MNFADFEPERKVVIAITNTDPAMVTATLHGYSTGDYVRINVPLNYGMRFPKNEILITVINVNSFWVNVNTTLLDAFVIPGAFPVNVAEVLNISGVLDNIAT